MTAAEDSSYRKREINQMFNFVNHKYQENLAYMQYAEYKTNKR